MTDEYKALRYAAILRMADSIDASVLDEACGERSGLTLQRIAQIKSLCLSVLSQRSQPDASKSSPSLTNGIRELNEYQNHFNRMVEPVD